MKYGLIGEKLGHSYSKLIHERLTDDTYNLIPLNRDAFIDFMEKREFNAINVTIPYKKDVIPYLDHIDEHAKKIGAVNTIVNLDHQLIGYNTDFHGFDYMVKHHNVNLANKKVIVLGNGGAAKAIIAVLQYHHVREIVIVKRSISAQTITYETMYHHHLDADVIINTSPVGMYPNNDESPLDLMKFHNLQSVFDIVYNPLKTRLILQAEKLHIQAIGGLEMLIAQAVYAIEYFKQTTIDKGVIDKIYHEILNEKQNIVLIGMPSAGKTTIASVLAKQLHRKLVDIDDLIVSDISMSISDYFQQNGESSFRTLEREKCKLISKENSLVISTGGGVVKDAENMDNLRSNSIVFYIHRDLNLLLVDPNRPLSKDKEAIKKIYEERHPLYTKYCDYEIQNNGEILDACESILNKLNA